MIVLTSVHADPADPDVAGRPRLTLFLSIALPASRSGVSLLDIFLEMLRHNPSGALTFLIMFASPQLFGLAVAIAGVMRNAPRATVLVRVPVSVLQALTVLAGMSQLHGSRAIAPLALSGFALVTSIYFLYASGEAAASPRERLSLHWHIRWGALLVVGVGLWLRLQTLRGVHLGIALDVAIVAAGLMLARASRRPSLA